MFRLGLVNPNTSAEHTEAMTAAAAAALGEHATVVPLTAERGPRSIESAVDHAVAAAEVVRMVAGAPDLDAYLLGCFDDPGIHALRELTSAPVVGIGEAAYQAASLVARRFSVITTLKRGIPALEDAIAAHGLASRCTGVVALGIPVADQGAAHAGSTDAIVAAARRSVEDDGAEAVVLACGAMSGIEAAVQERVGVPATNGVGFGALLAHALWRTRLGTSSVGSFMRPEPTPYDGMPSPSEMIDAASC
jgi:allantoin racemase